jgi:predicted TIM-barrel fold metal-dependent hydrolase
MKLDLIDTSVFCGHWPFRKLPQVTTREIKSHLTQHNVKRAWISAFETMLYPDPMVPNRDLIESTAGDPFFVSVAVINVTLATWQRDLNECLEKKKFDAIKLIPNYHQYELSDPRLAELLAIAGSANVPVCVQLRMQDERSHFLLMKVPAVKAADLAALAAKHPRNRFLACGAYRNEVAAFRDSSNVWAELSFVESGQALVNAINAMQPERIVFASHAPLYYFEAQAKKLDVDEVDATAQQLKAIAQTNAEKLLSGAH